MFSRNVRHAGLLAVSPLALLALPLLIDASPTGVASAPPICDAGPVMDLECSAPVMQLQLDATGSSASSGGALNYEWSGCGDDAFTLSDPSSPTPILTVDMSSACVVKCELKLRVWNSSGSSVCSTFIHVADTTAPVLTCPPDLTLELGDSTAPAATGMASATDLCNPNPTVTWSDDLSGVLPSGYGTLLRTWSANDGCFTSTCVQTIKIAKTIHFSLFPTFCPNELVVGAGNLAGGRVPASILGNAVDVAQVNLGSISFSTIGGFDLGSIQPINIAFADVGQPLLGLEHCECAVTAPDGKLDLFLEFDEQELIQVFGLQGLPSGTLVPVQIAGDLLTTEPFIGDDCILIRLP